MQKKLIYFMLLFLWGAFIPYSAFAAKKTENTTAIPPVTEASSEEDLYNEEPVFTNVCFWLSTDECVSSENDLAVRVHFIDTDNWYDIIFPAGENHVEYSLQTGTYEIQSMTGGNNVTPENYTVTDTNFIITEKESDSETTEIYISGYFTDGRVDEFTETDEIPDDVKVTIQEEKEKEVSLPQKLLNNFIKIISDNVINIILLTICVVFIIIMKKKK